MAVDTQTVLDIWDLLIHCAEPAESVSLQEDLKLAAQKQFEGKTGNASVAKPNGAARVEGVDRPMKNERDSGKYRIFLTPEGEPYPHESWSADMLLLIHKNDKGLPEAFRVYKNPKEAEEELPDDYSNSFHTPDVFTEGDRPALLCLFGRQYRCGPAAFDQNGKLKGQYKTSEIEFNYAEHQRIGNSLQLKFPDGIRSGKQTLKLTDEHKPGLADRFLRGQWTTIPAMMLSYGQVNGLGGDFYAGYNPICKGKDLEEQSKFFMEAFSLLAKPESVTEVNNILKNRQLEVDMLEECARTGESTEKGYAKLVQPGTWRTLYAGSKEDEELQAITMNRSGPTYMRMAQLNLDHFGENAHKAWQAGHFCALKEAAKPNADLELAYAMNAFADHYLADCFASGHMRTPRQVLHGEEKALDLAMKSLSGLVKGLWEDKTWKGLASQIAPDMLAKFMHDEDNSLGLWVTRRKDGKVWQAFGDKKLLEQGDEENEKCVIECLQADADEVYEVYRTKKLITDPSKFAAWDYMPMEVLETTSGKKNHQPLFQKDGKFRNFSPKVMKEWPQEYVAFKPHETYDLWQGLKAAHEKPVSK